MRRHDTDFSLGVFLLFLLFSIIFTIFPERAAGQRRVDRSEMYHRVWAVAPMIGSGTLADPIRPKHAPAALAPPGNRNGILGFAFTPTDDGKRAIVLFVAADRAALNEILQDSDPSVVSFARSRAGAASIEASLGRYKKNFHLRDLQVVVP